MNQSQLSSIFDKKHAESYDDKWARLGAMREALHLLTRILWSNLPHDARILCVGAGTGLEILSLAQHFPQWRFTALDTSGAMLDVCRQRTAAAGIAQRCEFHEGVVDSLPDGEHYDAATAFLVSQFVVNTDERSAFFGQIARRLKPEGRLASADIATDLNSPDWHDLGAMWVKMFHYAGFSDSSLDSIRASWDGKVGVLPPHEVAKIIARGGFEKPQLFLQTLLIHAWHARKA